MKGDFSHWHFDPTKNFVGVLHQQGRVLLDRDWNDQAQIAAHWQLRSGQDVIGAGLAAAPAQSPDGFKVVRAEVTGASPNRQVELKITPGRIWADGLLCYLPGAPAHPADPVTRVANYFQPPVDPTPGTIATIGPGVRDIVVLEVSHEEVNAFQIPDPMLLEPALGGPDTTQRAALRTEIKLYRAGAGQTCRNLSLDDKPADKGRLTVRLQPTVTVPGDCPVVMGGGYTGFEHFLYRIEIAAVNSGQPASFKWSQLNGGLVGRGRLVALPSNRITIDANHSAIVNSGWSRFYCEVVSFDERRGVWQPSFAAEVTLSGSDLLVGTVRLGAFAAGTEAVFFRLWNGIQPIADFDGATAKELLDGIQLRFDPATATNYAAGDFWTFPVRAGEIENPEVLISGKVRFGPIYHRVPLAEIHWTAANVPVLPPSLEDCRRRFRPLTHLDTCCTVRVGDGESSIGDFESIQEAIGSLPPEGGMVCILPGVYHENVRLDNLDNVILSGCGDRTRLLSSDIDSAEAVISICGGRNITVENLAVEAAERARGIDAQGRNPFTKVEQVAQSVVRELKLSGVTVSSSLRAAIRAEFVQGLSISECGIRVRDVTGFEHAVVILADDAEICRNRIEVSLRSENADRSLNRAAAFFPGSFAKGGLHLESLCERVRVADNWIRGGSGTGIILGSLQWYSEGGDPVPPEHQPPRPHPSPCDPTLPTDAGISVEPVDLGGDFGVVRAGAGGPLYDILIERNRIHEMGSEGIGVAGFFDLSKTDEFISVIGLSILANEIRGCRRRHPADPPKALAGFIAYGAIVLADVENLVIRDNTILDNGTDWHDALCGIFVLHGEGVEVVRNRIVNTGARTAEPVAGAHAGQRGGVVVVYAFPPTVTVNTIAGTGPEQNGIPALRVQGNVVSQPLGRALVATGVGPMSVTDNQLTSQGVVPTSVDATGFLAATIQIFNLGLSSELYLQVLLFGMLNKAGAKEYLAAALNHAASSARVGLDDAGVSRLLANGNVMFSDNQVNLNLIARGTSIALSSMLIVTLDDLACHDNQCEANLLDDFLFAQALLLGFSQSTSGNRWKEGLINATLSAVTVSFTMNTTTDNQGTHCIVVRGAPDYIVDDHNIALVQGVLGESEGICSRFANFLKPLSKKAG